MQVPYKTVIITGASRGIGRAIALEFARAKDYGLVLIARSEDKLSQTQTECLQAGAPVAEIILCDLSKPKNTADITLPSKLKVPDILINNAGSFLLKPLEKTGYREFNEQVQLNLFTAVNTTKRFLKELKSAERGHIINICSVGALQGLKESGAYSAAKHAMLGYTRSLREELKDTQVAVTAVNLGQTQSTSWEGSSVDSELLIDPADVASIVLNITELSERTVVEEILIAPQHGRVPPM